MKNYFPVSVLLVVLLMFNANPSSGANYVKESVTVDNLRATVEEIRLYYATTFTNGQVVDLSVAMPVIESMLVALFTSRPFSETCTPGPFLNMTFPPSANPASGGHDFIVEWESSLSTSSDYFAAYLDFTNLSSDYNISPQANVVLELPSYIDKKLYVFNGRCGGEQSSYYIIIVEKDLDFSSLSGTFGALPPGGNDPNGSDEMPNQPAPHSAPTSELGLSVFPNPSIQAPINIEFTLPVPQTVSLQLFDSQTGVLLQTIFSQQHFTKGLHVTKISLATLPAGIYYLRLRSEDQQYVKKLVRL